MKTTVSVTIDTDCYMLAKENIPNLSGFVNDVLKETLEQENPEAKKVFELRKYIDTLEKQTKMKEDTLQKLDTQIDKKEQRVKQGLCCKCESPATKTYLGQSLCTTCFMRL